MFATTGKSDPGTFAGGHYDDMRIGGIDWMPGSPNTDAITAIASKADVYAHPATNLATGRFIFTTEKSRQIALAFMGVGADNTEFDAFVWGWQRVRVEGQLSGTNKTPCPPKWVAIPLLQLGGTDGDVVLGARTVSDNQADPLALQNSTFTFRYADTIAIGEDYTIDATATLLGMTAAGAGADAWAAVVFDPGGVDLIEVEVTNNGEGTDTTRILPFYKRV